LIYVEAKLILFACRPFVAASRLLVVAFPHVISCNATLIHSQSAPKQCMCGASLAGHGCFQRSRRGDCQLTMLAIVNASVVVPAAAAQCSFR
jgi:hypothetical protein